MVEVIHRYQNTYPFGFDKSSENTFVLVLKENLPEEEISLFKQKSKILKEMNHSNFIKLHKMLKEENRVHLQFEYHSLSLEKYVKSIKK